MRSDRFFSLPGDLHLSDWPVSRPTDWQQIVEFLWEEKEVAQLRECAKRGRPFGQPPWVTATAGRLGLESSLRAPGRSKLDDP